MFRLRKNRKSLGCTAKEIRARYASNEGWKTRSPRSSSCQVIPRAFARTRHASSRPLKPGGICKGSVDIPGNNGNVHRIRTANGARVYPDVAKSLEPIAQDWLGHVELYFRRKAFNRRIRRDTALNSSVSVTGFRG